MTSSFVGRTSEMCTNENGMRQKVDLEVLLRRSKLPKMAVLWPDGVFGGKWQYSNQQGHHEPLKAMPW